MSNLHRQLVCSISLIIAGGLTIRGQAPPPYDVRVEFDQVSTGTTTFVVDKAGKVSGTMHIDTPNVVDATLAGTIKDGVWTFEYPFSMPDQNCTGTASGTAKVTADVSSVSGTVSISGGCAPQPMSGAFTFTKRPK
jgi:hypothetical protein